MSSPAGAPPTTAMRGWVAISAVEEAAKDVNWHLTIGELMDSQVN
ncbi:MAG: hypothetical protein ACRDRF_01915 [Pseudonocardiaceae bacterium]